MKLIDLELKNFRQHIDTRVDFTDGVTGIIGSNGSGKSTILEAIAWALYGAPAVRGTNDTIRSKAAEGGSKVNVSLQFELGGSVYKVARQLDGSGRSGSAVLEVDGRALRSGMSEVSDAVAKLLGMDYRAFFTSFFTGQKQLEFMAALDGRARATAISKMLGYDRVTKARDQANEDRKELHKWIEGMKESLPDPNELRARKETAQAQLKTANEALSVADGARKTAEEKLDKIKPLKEISDQKAKRYDEISRRLDIDRTDFNRLSENYKKLSAELTDLQAKKIELESLAPALERFEQASRDFRQLKDLQEHEGERQRLSGQIESIQSEVSRFESRLSQLADAPAKKNQAAAVLAEAETMLAEAEKKLQEARENQIAHEHSVHAQVKQLEWNRKDIEGKRKQIELAGASGACPTCERPLADELPVVLANFDVQIKAIDDQIHGVKTENNGGVDKAHVGSHQAARDKIAAQVEKYRCESAAADALAAEFDLISGQLRGKAEEMDQLKIRLAELPIGFDQARFRELQRTGEELRPAHDKSIALKSALERLDPITNELAEQKSLGLTKKNQIAESELALKELEFSPEEHEKMAAEFSDANNALNAALLVLERQKGEVGTATAILEAAQRDQESYDAKANELKEKQAQRIHLKTVAEAMDKLRADLNDRIKPEFEAIAGELLSTMTDGRYSVLVIDDNYEAKIKDDGEIKEVISGGEDDIVNLALRLAISQMIADRAGQSFSLLVLDEVFGSLDDARRDNVVSLLQNLKNRFEQIILITHVESIHDAMDNCLWVSFDERTKTSRLIDKAVELELV